MKIYISSDHAGFELKKFLKEALTGLDYEVVDNGPDTYSSDDDYPDYISITADLVSKEKESFGIVIGGSGQGEAICANRYKGVQAIVCYGLVHSLGELDVSGSKSTGDGFDIIRLGRMHNNANILSLGSRFVSKEDALNAVQIFLNTKFSEEERHVRRILKIDNQNKNG
ncbi:MAG: RpiB/LacA/LacB family sugar-phosphate isomerase [Candidatus Pacebacteria bacterium]|nr:RpiB/LacA/LacB family sugar-phosphate isomerase [Candidatus Paceibacterota bacterium]MCF7862836.1 RpiB/LacA/LacB family sugar-phosphate isomerase [Candidatus Paceibacterota bacterium]